MPLSPNDPSPWMTKSGRSGCRSFAAAPLGDRRGQLLEDAAGISDDADVHRPVAADLRAVAVDLHDLRHLRDSGAVPEAEVERGPGDHHHVRFSQSLLARLREEVR